MPRRYETAGLQELAKLFPKSLEMLDRFYRGPGNYPPEKNQLSMRMADVNASLEVACFRHWEIDISDLDIERFLREGVEVAIDYFYGDYLQTNEKAAKMMRKSPDNQGLDWIEAYRNGLFLAMLSGNETGEQTLIGYVEPWLPFDESSYLLTPEDNHYHKILAEFLRSGDVQSVELEAKIKAARKQRPKLLLACIDAIRQQDAKAFSASLKKFVDYYLKSEFAQQAICNFCSIEASILWHVARRHGVEPTGLSEKQLNLIVTRESLGLAA